MVARKNKTRGVLRKKQRKTRTLRKQRGAGYAFGAPLTSFGLSNAPGSVQSTGTHLCPDCVASSRPTVSVAGTGLPGVTQRGGRYGFPPLSAADLVASGGPGLGGSAPVRAIPCESSATTANRSPLLQGGGAAPIDQAYIISSRGGYTQGPSAWVSSTGTPSLESRAFTPLQTNPVCSGGGTRKRKSKQRKSKQRR
jgi:hypothetical protein